MPPTKLSAICIKLRQKSTNYEIANSSEKEEDDILDAEFGTDDRQFYLRGSSSKRRSYTITYEVTEQSGETKAAETHVVIEPYSAE
jgi:hypothetical protein